MIERGLKTVRRSDDETRGMDLFHDAPIGYHELDQTGRILRVNGTELSMLGYTAEEMVGQPVWKFVVEEESSRYALLEKLAGEVPSHQSFECTYRRKDGTTVPVLVDDRILKDKEGRGIGLRGALRDISELKRAEMEIRILNEELECRVLERTRELETANLELQRDIAERKRIEGGLQEQRLLLETILRQAAEAIVVCDERGQLTFVNAAARRMAFLDPVGKTLEEGSTIWGEAHDGDGRRIPGEEQPLAKALGGEVTICKRLRMFRPDGSFYDILISAAPLRGPDQRIMGAVATFSNITKRTEAEEEIKKLNQDLQRRTSELEAANRELEAFTYSVSHDLKTPLLIIDAMSRKLTERFGERLEIKFKDYLHHIRSASQQMAQLIEDLLSLAHITRSDIKIQRVDLTTIAKSIAKDLQRTETERLVEFIIVEGLDVEGDPRLLRVALGNLLGNAWKFTGQREQAIIEFGKKETTVDPIYFVRDNGCGFDMIHLEKIFKPFQRLHTIEEFPGMGIGLATVERIIKRHGGRIWAESALNRGTTFFFTLNPKTSGTE